MFLVFKAHLGDLSGERRMVKYLGLLYACADSDTVYTKRRMEKNRRLLMVGYYGFGNLGDEAIRIVLDHALKHIGAFQRVFLVAKPQGEDEVNRSSPTQVLRALRCTSALVFGGGGLLQNRTSQRSLLYYLFLILLARLTHRPVFLLGQGVGPIRGRPARMATRFALKHVSHIGCRDRGSLSLLGEMGLAGVLDGDLFFLHPPLEGPLTAPQADPPRITLSLKGPGVKLPRRLVDRWVDLLESVRARTDATFTLLPFFPTEDLPLAEIIARKLTASCQIICPHSVEQAGNEIAKTNLIIASRLHPLEVSLRVGTPILAIATDPKTERFIEEVGALGAPQIASTEFPSLKEVLLFLNRPPARDSLLQVYNELHERTHAAFAAFVDEVKAAVGGPDD